MVKILKKLHENDVSLKIDKVHGDKDILICLEKFVSLNTYRQQIFIDIEMLDKAKDPVGYITDFLDNTIDNFLINIMKIENVKPTYITIS